MDKRKRRLGFVILAWNSRRVLEPCLTSIFALQDFETCTVVVNNGSTDDTEAYLNTIRPTEQHGLQVITLERNSGTTATRNAGLRLLRRQQVEYYCVLDSDTVVNDKALGILADTLESDPQIGLVGPQMTTSGGLVQVSGRRFPSMLDKLCKAMPFRRLQQLGEQMEELPDRTTDGTPYPVDYMMSACWLIRPEVLERVGMLDENIFYAPEDAEYCIRVWKGGYRCVFCPEAQIIHEWQRLSKKKLISKMNWEHIKGLIYMFRKHGYWLRTEGLWEQIRQRELPRDPESDNGDNRIKILQVGLKSNPGGMESFVLNYHRHLDRDEFCFDYADVFGEGIAHTAEIESLGGRVLSLGNSKRHPLRVMRGMKRLLGKGEYDIVHINLLSSANILLPLAACRYAKGPVIVHAHNAAVPSGRLRRVLHRVNVRLLRRLPVEKWACGQKAGLWMWGEAFEERNIVPNAIDETCFAPDAARRAALRAQCGFAPSDAVIGFVGRLSEQKNVLFLPEILSELRRKGKQYKMLLVGGGEKREELEAAFAAAGLADAVFFAGVQESAAAWYQAMDAFVLPSLFEGLPVVGVEAQAAGLPCFFSDQITEEIDLTDAAAFLPIDQGGTVWAKALKKGLRQPRRKGDFPETYRIRCAVRRLEERYRNLAGGRRNADG